MTSIKEEGKTKVVSLLLSQRPSCHTWEHYILIPMDSKSAGFLQTDLAVSLLTLDSAKTEKLKVRPRQVVSEVSV